MVLKLKQTCLPPYVRLFSAAILLALAAGWALFAYLGTPEPETAAEARSDAAPGADPGLLAAGSMKDEPVPQPETLDEQIASARAAAHSDVPTRTLRVVDFEGRPVPRATAYAYGRTRTSMDILVVVDGRAQFRAEATTLIEVVRAEAADGTALPLASAGRSVGSEKGDLEIRLPPAFPIEGQVIGPDGLGVSGVELIAMPGDFFALGSGQAVSGEDGSFRIEYLSPGLYALQERGYQALPKQEVAGQDAAPRSRNGSRKFVPILGGRLITRAGSMGVKFQLRTCVNPVLRLVDPRGQRIRGATVRVIGAPSSDLVGVAAIVNERVIVVGEQGTAHLGALDPSRTYALRIEGPGGRLRWLRDPWTPRDERIELGAEASIRGVVEEHPDHDFVYLRIFVEDAAGGEPTQSPRPDAQGRFEVSGLESGRYRVAAARPDELPRAALRARGVVVEAGASDVVLPFTWGQDALVRIDGEPEDALAVTALLMEDAPANVADRRRPLVHGSVVKCFHLEATSRYSLWVHQLHLGRYGLLRGFRPSDPDLQVTLVEGRSIPGVLKAPEGVALRSLTATMGSIEILGTLSADGTFELRGLPEGLWHVSGVGESSSWTRYEGSVDVQAGDRAVITLERR